VKIEDILSTAAIWLDLPETEKDALLRRMAGGLAACAGLVDADCVTQAILDREARMSTGIGYGIAIPHCRLASVRQVGLIVGRTSQEVEFAAIDDVPVRIVFMLAAPQDPSAEYAQLLATISKVVAVADTRLRLLAAGTREEFLQVLIVGEKQFQPSPAKAV
jgi:mannitol/fructose-specific phosphotransferase system IIA component (Ntr-type)